jgi:hypothetical protein
LDERADQPEEHEAMSEGNVREALGGSGPRCLVEAQVSSLPPLKFQNRFFRQPAWLVAFCLEEVYSRQVTADLEPERRRLELI